MHKFRIDHQHLRVVNLNSILINEILVTEFMTESFTKQNSMRVQIRRFPLSNCSNKKPQRKLSSKQTEINIPSSINQMVIQ